MARPAQAAGPSTAPIYSRAFDRIVHDADDVVGLLAYALYKEAVREEVSQGAAPNPAARNPPNAVVKIYREAAEQRLSVVINGGIAQATPDIEAAAIGNVVKASENMITTKLDGVTTRLEEHVNKRTGFLSSITTNLIAWLLSLAITIIILLLANRGGIEEAAVNGAQRLMDGNVTKTQPGKTTE
jgi:hypothetical protein